MHNSISDRSITSGKALRRIMQKRSSGIDWPQRRGVARAQGNLGVMHFLGQGVVQDYVHAHMWFNLDAASGNLVAMEKRNILATLMTTQQIAEAQKMAIECQKNNFKGCD